MCVCMCIACKAALPAGHGLVQVPDESRRARRGNRPAPADALDLQSLSLSLSLYIYIYIHDII